ncbi:MAG: hypothetical protein IT582_08575 [Opitutaceae bacterium]|nr:hypothetical protein [Opitutaceae bacterium]
MGFFDRLAGKKTPVSSPVVPAPAPAPVATPASPALSGNIMPRLIAARAKLEAKDVPGAIAIYEEVLAVAGERADVLVTISGDLGTTGNLREITELIGPRYDAEKHGPATGLNLLQAYLALRNADAAQHVLDILFDLKRPDLEERLHGFSNAIADLMATGQMQENNPTAGGDPEQVQKAQISLVTISKPIWSYGLEAVGELFPPRPGNVRRVAFAQLALTGLANAAEFAKQPEEEMGRLSRAIPLWLAEAFSYSPSYAALAALGVHSMPGTPGHYAVFPAEWSTDNLRQLVDTAGAELDYIFTGALRQQSGDYEMILRVWEVKKFRERKQIALRWTPATADAELAKLHDYVRQFMEWNDGAAALPYAAPAAPRAWLETLGASATLFLAEKNVLAPDQLPELTGTFATTAAHAADNEAAAMACLTLHARARGLGINTPLPAQLFRSPLVEQARAAL